MARNGIGGRERVCVTCEKPSPGPIRLLWYRWRDHGSFFPLLERLKTDDNARLFVNGRVPVCTSCANYLQRQWNDYETKNITLPIQKRTYRLLSDERWERVNRKKYLEEQRRKAEENVRAMTTSYDDNDNVDPHIKSPAPSVSKAPPEFRKSKIPRPAAKRRVPNQDTMDTGDGDNGVTDKLALSLAVNDGEMSSISQDDNKRSPSTGEIKTRMDKHNSKLMRKMAEMKFQEELEYLQRKMQKTMTMVNFKGSEERIREIEEELKAKIGEDLAEQHEFPKGQEPTRRVIMPRSSESINELKEHIDRQLDIQRQEMAKFRKSIQVEIAQAMADSHRRNEDLWCSIIDMNEERRKERRVRKHRPYSESEAYIRELKAMAKRRNRDRMSDMNDEKNTDDVEYEGYHY